MAGQFPKHPSQMLATTKSGGTATAAIESKMLLWIGTEKVTPFAPALLERMARAKTINNNAPKLTNAIRNSAQTNPAFRGERLVASAVNLISDRVKYAVALKDASTACFDNIKPLSDYANEMADVNHAIGNYQDVMLRQIMLFVIKPWQDFTKIHYPKILQEYAELEKRRDKYDQARAKKSANTVQIQQTLIEQANLMDDLLYAIVEHQMNGAKAIDMYIRAECQYLKEVRSLVRSVKSPDYKRRWMA